MAGFEYRNAEDVRDVFKRHGVKYLFFGKSGAILLGFSDTTRVEVFVEKHADNCEQLATALSELGFRLTEQQTQEIRRGKGDGARLGTHSSGPFAMARGLGHIRQASGRVVILRAIGLGFPRIARVERGRL